MSIHSLHSNKSIGPRFRSLSKGMSTPVIHTLVLDWSGCGMKAMQTHSHTHKIIITWDQLPYCAFYIISVHDGWPAAVLWLLLMLFVLWMGDGHYLQQTYLYTLVGHKREKRNITFINTDTQQQKENDITLKTDPLKKTFRHCRFAIPICYADSSLDSAARV